MTSTQHSDTARPQLVDRDTWLAERDALLPREKAHTREGDAIAAARRRLPMTEVDADLTLTGPNGDVRLIDLFGDHDQLIVYKHMWHPGQPFEGQCPGCTASIWDFRDPAYLNVRDIAFAVVTEGPWQEVEPFIEFMGYQQDWYSAPGVDDPVFGGEYGEIVAFLRDGDKVYQTYATTNRGVEAIMSSFALMDMAPYGRREQWEDSPAGWPQGPTFGGWMKDGRPTGQWTRPGVTPVAVAPPKD